jgi:ATP-dependent Clp protease ATP-binding subunit ClpX
MHDRRPGFDEEAIRRIVALAEAQKAADCKEWTATAIFARLDTAIIGNRRYKESLAVCLADFLAPAEARNHILVAGPSGSGKTYLLERCVPDFGLACHFIDASSLVPSGYKGSTLPEVLEPFFRSRLLNSKKCILVLDEFDKLSERANGGDTFKSQSLQSELLALIQGKAEGVIDTQHALWILAGAFAYADEMRSTPPRLRKVDLLKYGFKNELLGRITHITMTEIPTTEEVVRRVLSHESISALTSDLEEAGHIVTFMDEAVLELALAAQNPTFGMRIIPTLALDVKRAVLFRKTNAPFIVTADLIKTLVLG